MSQGTSGLERDLSLIRRRAWLFIPFFILGVLVAVAFGSLAGPSNAVATMQLETVVQDLVLGGDRGMRIFEAQSMTADPRFQQRVREQIGDPNFDYSRFVISLSPISVADGVSRGVLTVSITDDKKVNAEAYRAAWVAVFTREYQAPDGLFRQRFIQKKQDVVDVSEKNYQDAFAALKAQNPTLPLDTLVRPASQRGFSYIEELERQEADLQRQQAEVEAALASGANGAVASLLLGAPIAAGDARAALEARRATLTAALESLRSDITSVSDSSLPEQVRGQVANLRALADIRQESYVRLNNARVAVTSAQSDVETSYTFSGGVSGTLFGRVAVVIAITLVFGLIAIYAWEWLGQLRSGPPGRHEPAA